MKKITLIAVAFIAVSFASCKKAKTCTCTTVYSNGNGADITTTSYDKTSSATGLCPKTETNTKVSTTTSGGVQYSNSTTETTSCTLS